MGRKTACDASEWRQILSQGLRELARELRLAGMKKIDINTWRKYAAEYLRTAADLAIEDCDVNRIVNESVQQVLKKLGV